MSGFRTSAFELAERKRRPKRQRDGHYSHDLYSHDLSSPQRQINERSEEFTTKPAFKDAWRRGQRCLVITNGFYEWKKLDPKGKLKPAYAVGMADDSEMVMAGL